MTGDFHLYLRAAITLLLAMNAGMVGAFVCQGRIEMALLIGALNLPSATWLIFLSSGGQP